MNALSSSEDRVLTVPEVAKFLQISKTKVYYLAKRGTIPCIRLGGNVRIGQSEFLKWLELQAQKGK